MSELPKFMGTNIHTQNQRLIMLYTPISPSLVYIHMKPKSTVQISVLDVCIPTAMKVSVINISMNYNMYVFPLPSYYTSAIRGLWEGRMY
jgi:hypothetical protein